MKLSLFPRNVALYLLKLSGPEQVQAQEDDSPIQLTPEQYISKRVKQYQGWYDKKSVRVKRRYLQMRGFSVIGGGLVPVLVNLPTRIVITGVSINIQAIVTIISLLVVV